MKTKTASKLAGYLLVMALLVSAIPVRPSLANGDAVNSLPAGPPAILRVGKTVNFHRTPLPAQALGPRSAQTASFDIVYLPAGATDFFGTPCLAWPAQAKAAFSYTAGIWETLIDSAVTITIHACWADLDEGVLGYGGTDNQYGGFSGVPEANTWYPSALANALHGSDLDPTRPDMHLAYNKDFDDVNAWYYGTDGNPSGSQADFVSVVLHEIAHGLGFSGSMNVTGGQGCWGMGSPYPVNYDRFAQDGSGTALINTAVYPNPSNSLAAALTGNNVWFSGSHANAANGGGRVKLYAPPAWQPGSSYAHLDEVYNGTQNALMTYALDPGESNHAPGPVALGILEDLGWTMNAPPVVSQNLIRNGGFDADKAGWVTNPIGTSVGDGFGKNGVGYGMQIWPEFADHVGYIWQELYLPTQTTAATLSFDYLFLPQSGAGLGYFSARVVTDTGTLATLVYVTPTNFPGLTWQTTGPLALSAGDLAAVNAAHAAGQHLYLLIDLYAQALYVNLDNVSLTVQGNKSQPAWDGSIAFIGLDGSGYAKTVNRINPDGSSRQTLWTHPGTGITNKIGDVAWNPDASELAFASDHESLYSAFHSDVYRIKPDGSDLHRITNPPSRARLLAGGHDTGTVTGQVRNDYGSLIGLLLYVQGAQEAVSVSAPSRFDEVSFTVPNVAVLDGLQYVVFTWADAGHANCKEYTAAIVPMVANQTIDVGTLSFNPATCNNFESEDITWKRDGTEVAADIVTPRKFQASGQAIGVDLFNAPLAADQPAWSPVNDQILYRYASLDANTRGIYLTTVGGGTGTRLVNDGGALWVEFAWLPDGSGFVYTLDHQLYHYNLANSVSTPIANFYNEYIFHPSVSPDGRYVVFQWQTGTNNQHDLWIVDRNNPVEMWQLTNDGKSANPDWSRQAPQLPPTCPLPLTGASLSGPASGQIGQDLAFTVSPQPATATAPITYTWSTDGLVSGQGSNQAIYRWNSTGDKSVQVAVRNCGGQNYSGSQTVSLGTTCPKPLVGVSVTGQCAGYINMTYQFSAIAAPDDATTPITYTWSADGLISGQGSSQASYRWASTGAHAISLTATNCGGSVSDDHTVNLTNQPASCAFPLTDFEIDGPTIGVTGQNLTFTSRITPTTATTPITYTWSSEGLVSGQASGTAVYNWSTPGQHQIIASAANCGGEKTDTYQLVIAPEVRIYLPFAIR